jgi:hypothetical protein
MKKSPKLGLSESFTTPSASSKQAPQITPGDTASVGSSGQLSSSEKKRLKKEMKALKKKLAREAKVDNCQEPEPVEKLREPESSGKPEEVGSEGLKGFGSGSFEAKSKLAGKKRESLPEQSYLMFKKGWSIQMLQRQAIKSQSRMNLESLILDRPLSQSFLTFLSQSRMSFKEPELPSFPEPEPDEFQRARAS